MYTIYGYGEGDKPLKKGSIMGTGTDFACTRAIIEALAVKFTGQWFGYSYKVDGKTAYSAPMRMKAEFDTN